jgi:hypothetical protein
MGTEAALVFLQEALEVESRRQVSNLIRVLMHGII